jgi:hypothetical protein
MEAKLISTRSTCRVCGSPNLTPILSLGNLYVSDFTEGKEDENDKYPLELILCDVANGGCGLLQLKHTVSHESMYRNYWYRSGMNQTMTNELFSIAARVGQIVPLKAGDYVIDIGANDGTLLRGYQTPGLSLIGYEPARNLEEYNRVGTTKIFVDFFNAAAWEREFPGKKAKVITAIAMFYDLEDPNAFVADVAKCLDKNGIFVIQMSYLPLMLATNEVGNICHEHLEYYSLLSLEFLLRRHNLEVFDVELNDINGGSFRVYIKHKNGEGIHIPLAASARLAAARAYERDLNLSSQKVYDEFVARVNAIKDNLVKFIKQEKTAGKKIYVYGASTKGNTVLQYFGIDHNLISAAAERNEDKWGKRTVGTGIPIISEEQARSEQPDYFLVLPWHFLDEFMKREKNFLKRGGKFIVPFPEMRIIGDSE